MVTKSRRGAMLIAMALFFAVIGILFGLGRLKLHEYRVIDRIERQYGIQKLLATRSALALVRYECQPQGSEFTFPVYSNLVYYGSAPAEAMTCHVVPTPALDTQEMDVDDFDSTWGVFASDGAGVAPRRVEDITDVLFAVEEAKTNQIYRCAIFMPAKQSWLASEFGYLYRLRMLRGGTETGFDKLRLYLVGTKGATSPTFITADNYLTRIRDYPSIMMELSLQVGTTNRASRSLRVNNGGDGKEPLNYTSFLTAEGQDADAISHGGGFLLSGTAMVGFGEAYSRDLYFSNRIDLNRVIATNDFVHSWIVIEHVFSTNRPGESLSISVDSFVMREPTTYSIATYNRALEQALDISRRHQTWVFQTRYPRPSYNPPIIGRQCILDTFGGEKTGLRQERAGIWPN